MMEWMAATQTNGIWWICLLLASLVSISRQEAPNQTVLLGDEGGAGSGPFSGKSEHAADGAAPGESGSGNKTFSFIRSGSVSLKEAPNASIDKLGQSLARLEGSLGSLIQSFLAMQRSVSNLEQLQELLVLLLEDILKQTGHVVKNPKATRKGTDHNDPDTKSSNESNEDDIIGGGGGGEGGRHVNGNAPRGNGAGKDGDDFSLASRPLGDSQNEPQSNQDKGPKVDATPSSSLDKTSRDAGSSGEDHSASEDIDALNAKPYLDQWRPAPQDKGPSRSPQWAEPMTIDRGNILAMFREAVSRLIARPPAADEFQQLRLLREDHRETNALTAESPAESPPRIFEPLEVRTSERNFLEKQVREETLPVQVRLSHLSPVVSHGGPLNGPEKSASPFLDDLSDIVGKEYSGERPTGMINNLKLPDTVLGMSGNDSSEELQSTYPSAIPDNTTSFVRRRRQAWDKIVFSFKTASHDTAPVVTTSIPLKTNITNDELKGLTLSSPRNVSLGSNYTSQTNVTDSLGYGEDLAWNDYDHLIDSLLKDLSDKLKEYQSHQRTGDLTIDRAVHELNKLIWMPSFDYVGGISSTNGTLIADIAYGPENASFFVSQPMESYTKHVQFSPSHESQLHKEKQINSTYLIQSKKKIENSKAKKQLGMEMQNGTTLKQQESDLDQTTNSTSEWMWIASVPSAMRMPEADLKWLTETLVLLSQRQDLAKDMKEIDRRAWGVSLKKLENRDPPRLDTNTAEVDNDLEEKDDWDEDVGERQASLNSINGVNSLTDDNSHDTLGVSNRLDEAIQEVIKALKDSMQGGNTVSDRAHPMTPTTRENVVIPDMDSGLGGFHGQHEDTLEHDEEDSDDTSHEDRDLRGNNNRLHVGEIHMQHAEHPVATQEKHHMTFPTYLRHHREKRSRHKRLSGMLWRHLLQPQPPDGTQIRNQGGSPPLDQQSPTQQSRNNSVPYSNGLLSSYLHMHPYRRHLTNEPWGQRLLRPYGSPLGYSNYMSHLGINNPNLVHQALEPDEPPANDALGSMDVEDVLAALFQRYWQRLFDVYSKSNPLTTTTEEPDHDGESITASPSNPAGEKEANTTSTSSPATVTTTDNALPISWQEIANQTLKAT